MNAVCAMKGMSVLHIKQQVKVSASQIMPVGAAGTAPSMGAGEAAPFREPGVTLCLKPPPPALCCSSSAPGEEINDCS